MKKVIIVILSIFLAANVFAGDDKKKKQAQNEINKPDLRQREFFLMATETGIGVGYRLKYSSDAISYRTFSFQFVGAREPDEIVIYDIWGRPQKIRDFYTLLIPLTVGYHRRLGADSIEDNIRPFFNLDVGPIIGWSAPVGNGFKENVRRSSFEFSIAGFVGIGIEYMQKDAPAVTLSAGYRIAHFFDQLSEQKNFSVFYLKLGLVHSF